MDFTSPHLGQEDRLYSIMDALMELLSEKFDGPKYHIPGKLAIVGMVHSGGRGQRGSK
jgi:hypothetical protein